MPSSISVHEFAPISQKGGFDLIDVRTPSEFFEVHAVGALLAPLDTLNPKAIMESRGDRISEPLYVICRSGGRSAQACRLFQQSGFTNTVNIDGGTQAWIAAGLPVNRGVRKPISMERQIRIVAGLATALSATGAFWIQWLLIIPILIGVLQLHSGLRNSCWMAKVLGRLPWNRSGSAAGACGGCSGGSCGFNS